MAKERTIEDKLLSSHEERVNGLTSLVYFTMKNLCKTDIPDQVALITAKKVVEDWLEAKANDDEGN